MERNIRLRCPRCGTPPNYLTFDPEGFWTCVAGHRFKTVGLDTAVANSLFDLQALTEHQGCPKGKVFRVLGEP